MINQFFKLLLISFLICISTNTLAQVPTEFTKLLEAEQYSDALKLLSSYDDIKLPPKKKYYLTAICYSRLREYDQSIIFFKKAIKEHETSPDLEYEYGQALYANNNLKQARYELSKSAGKNFNYIASTYYVAYISELLNDYVTAKSNYKKLIKDGRTDKKFLQVALFQYTKLLLKMMRIEENSFKSVERSLIRLDISLQNYIPKYIFPLLKKTIEVDPKSELSMEAQQFMYTLQEEFKLDPNTMANGRRISADRLYANIAQRIKYDDNVAITNHGSTLYETEGFLKYDFLIKKRAIVTPELRLTYVSYKAQETPAVYKNDSFTIGTALRNKFEHTYNGQPASFLLDFDYSSLYKDWKITHKREFFSKSYSVAIGEELSLSSSGETYFKLRQTNYSDESGVANYKSTSVSADQYIFLKEGQHLFIATIDFSQLNYYENEDLSNNTLLLRGIYLVFEAVPTYTLQFILSTTITDTKNQKDIRGYELTINPSFDITKALSDKIRLSVNYSFTQNNSKESFYKYRKSVVGAELSYTF